MKNKGITLIALVITIIVLLILAGVSISILTGENGILNNANKSKEKTETVSKREEKQINVLETIIENNGKTTQTIDEVIENLKEEIGSYVEYGIDLNKDNDYTNDWKLFYAGNQSGESRLFLIAADYIPTNNENLKISMNLAKMQEAEDEDCSKLSVYWGQTAPEYKGMEEEEKDKVLDLFMYSHNDLDTYYEKNNVKCVSNLINPANWESFKSDKAQYVIGGPTLEMWCAAWNATEPEKDGFVKLYCESNLNGFGYFFGPNKGTSNVGWVNMYGEIMNKSPMARKELEILVNKYSVFYPHTQSEGINANGTRGNCYGYWIASPRAMNDKDPMAVNVDMESGNLSYCDFCDIAGRGIRPVVCLNSEIRLNIKGVANDGNKIYSIE